MALGGVTAAFLTQLGLNPWAAALIAVIIGCGIGYIIGFIVMAVIAGLFIDNCRKPWIQLIGMIVGTIVCYLFGTVWFCIVAGYTFQAALAVCVIPFIPADLVKMIIAMIIGPMIKKRIR